LGPDWVAKFDNSAPTMVGNHTSWMDIIMLLHLVPNLTGFVARAETKTLIGIGKFADYFNCLYVNRLNKESRSETYKAIGEHQQRYMDGKDTMQLTMFPEGSSSNGQYLMSFKKGAFGSLLPV
jgi:lysophosphatidylcholine acyltransferase/lyso-PAF acetyltransferase